MAGGMCLEIWVALTGDASATSEEVVIPASRPQTCTQIQNRTSSSSGELTEATSVRASNRVYRVLSTLPRPENI